MNDPTNLKPDGMHLLVVEDQPALRELLENRLRDRGLLVQAAATVDEARRQFDRTETRPRLVMLDLDLGRGVDDGFALLDYFREVDPSVPVVVLTGNATPPNAARAFRSGASDFLEKSDRLGEHVELCLRRLQMLMEAIAENLRLKDHISVVQARLREEYRLVGVGFAVDELRKSIARHAPEDVPLLIVGEAGSGKETVAGNLHLQGARARRPFVVVRPASIAPDRLDEALLGRADGAVGQIERADGGTVYIDELNLLPASIQQKLLRTIVEGRLPRDNGAPGPAVDVRLLFGSVLPAARLAELDNIDAGLMDLLSERTIRVLPLRDRPEDIEALVHHFASRQAARPDRKRPLRFTPESMKKLRRHSWPGNLDELRGVVQQAVAASRDGMIGPFDIHFAPEADPADKTFTDKLQAYEKRLLLDALTQCNFRQNRAARLLGMTYDQFRHYYRKYDLGRTRHL